MRLMALVLLKHSVCFVVLRSFRTSVGRRGKSIDLSSKSNFLRRRGKKITTPRRECVGVVVEKIKKVDELSQKIRVIYLQQ